ncbi:MAG: twin-arginine translocase TatA/TatE family subunit [Selenomonadaceae bacterium]|nr:twin-arginine translocase TatA/TatE family subunit [Selenomonadaceae bacterium]
MFGIGIPEFILILVVGLVVFGPSKLPEIGRAVGKGIREFRKASNAFQNILNAPDDTPARTMAETHGKKTEKPEPFTDEIAQTEVKAEVKVETVDLNKKETAEEPQEVDVVKLSEKANGYTPPTKESVQQEIEKMKTEENNK